jgi:hypothetical protein
LGYTGEQLERFFKEPGFTPHFTEEDFEAMKKERPEPSAPRLKPVEDDSLLTIKQDYIRKTLEKATPIGRRREIGGVSLALILSPDPVTQEEIMEATGYGRSTVSENLRKIEELNVLSVVKKPGDRKKYYKSLLRLEGYGTQKFQIQRGGYGQIVKMIEGRFLPELKKIPGVPEERERLERFFGENVRAYGLILEYISFLHDFMLKRTETFDLP